MMKSHQIMRFKNLTVVLLLIIRLRIKICKMIEWTVRFPAKRKRCQLKWKRNKKTTVTLMMRLLINKKLQRLLSLGLHAKRLSLKSKRLRKNNLLRINPNLQTNH